MVHIVPRLFRSQKSFKDLLIIAETTVGQIIGIIYGCGEKRASGAGNHVYSGGVQGGNWRVNLLDDSDVELKRVVL